MFPAVVIRLAGGDFARPVNRQTQALELGPHVVDVFVGPLGRCDVVVDGGVFSRHAESVPAQGLQNILAQHALVAGDHVTNGVVAHMTHVQLAARVRKHRQAIESVLAWLFTDFKRLLLIPERLGGGFDFTGLIEFVHGYFLLRISDP